MTQYYNYSDYITIGVGYMSFHSESYCNDGLPTGTDS